MRLGGPKTGLDAEEKNNFLPLPGIEPRHYTELTYATMILHTYFRRMQIIAVVWGRILLEGPAVAAVVRNKSFSRFNCKLFSM
jgi:hypothetical protein